MNKWECDINRIFKLNALIHIHLFQFILLIFLIDRYTLLKKQILPFIVYEVLEV